MKLDDRMTRQGTDAVSFLFTLDEHNGSPAWVKSVAGGGARAELISQPASGDESSLEQLGMIEIQLSTIEVQPITVELAMGAGSPILDWLESAWSGAYARRTGAI